MIECLFGIEIRDVSETSKNQDSIGSDKKLFTQTND